MDKCNEVAIKEISRGLELMTQLRALLLPISATTNCSDLATGLFEYVLQAFSTALAALRPSRGPDLSYVPPVATSIGSSCSNDRGSESSHNKKRKNTAEEKEETSNSTGDKKRRRMSGGDVIITSVPHNDGRQWRKYGQKYIHGSNNPRNYYRCAYGRNGVRECLATKSVQQMDRGDPPKYIVIYKMQHSCKQMETDSRKVMDSMPRNASVHLRSAMGSEGSLQKSIDEQQSVAISVPAQEISSVTDDTSTTILPLSFESSFELETMRNSASFTADVCEGMSIWALESYDFEEEWTSYMNSVGSDGS